MLWRGRIHWYELHDFQIFPHTWRRYVTDVLCELWSLSLSLGFIKAFLPLSSPSTTSASTNNFHQNDADQQLRQRNKPTTTVQEDEEVKKENDHQATNGDENGNSKQRDSWLKMLLLNILHWIITNIKITPPYAIASQKIVTAVHKLTKAQQQQQRQQQANSPSLQASTTGYSSLYHTNTSTSSTTTVASSPKFTPVTVNENDHLTHLQIVDLCSGGGGPTAACRRYLLAKHKIDARFILTDLFPNIPAYVRMSCQDLGVSYSSEPVDATNCVLKASLRTMFASFHHFTPDLGGSILQDAVKKQQGIVIVEVTHNSWTTILFTMLFVPMASLVLTPLICWRSGFSLARLFWTYVIPVVPFVLAHDGVISCLRTYSIMEMQQLIAVADPQDTFDWAIAEQPLVPFFPVKVVSLVGTPKAIIPKSTQ